MALPLELPPSPFVREFCSMLDADSQNLILDLGCSIGRNSIELAKLGNKVIGVNNNFDEIKAAADTVSTLDLGSGSCNFIAGDARRLMFRGSFDAVLINEMLHMVSKPQAEAIISNAQALTKIGGLNVVSGYVVNSDEVNATNRAHCFSYGELRNLYEGNDWRILRYEEDFFRKRNFGHRELIDSLAKIIAVRQ